MDLPTKAAVLPEGDRMTSISWKGCGSSNSNIMQEESMGSIIDTCALSPAAHTTSPSTTK
jgi:hypothetical protein